MSSLVVSLLFPCKLETDADTQKERSVFSFLIFVSHGVVRGAFGGLIHPDITFPRLSHSGLVFDIDKLA